MKIDNPGAEVVVMVKANLEDASKNEVFKFPAKSEAIEAPQAVMDLKYVKHLVDSGRLKQHQEKMIKKAGRPKKDS